MFKSTGHQLVASKRAVAERAAVSCERAGITNAQRRCECTCAEGRAQRVETRAAVSYECAAVSFERATVSSERAAVSCERATVSSEHAVVSSERTTVSFACAAVTFEKRHCISHWNDALELHIVVICLIVCEPSTYIRTETPLTQSGKHTRTDPLPVRTLHPPQHTVNQRLYSRSSSNNDTTSQGNTTVPSAPPHTRVVYVVRAAIP